MTSPLLIDDKNPGDYGRPFGTYASIVKSAAKRLLEEQGKKPTLWEIDHLYMAHMQSLPSYKTISERRVRLLNDKETVSADFTEAELRAILERFAMANDPDSQRICVKISSLLQVMGAW